jgi:spectinomycin phosphotransferase
VLTEPRDLDRARLMSLLDRHWGIRGARLDYRPVGFGSHHWLATGRRGRCWWMSVDDLEAGFQAGLDADGAFAALDRAFRTAASLRDDAGLEFVVAPLQDDEGVVLRRVDERYALRVAPLIDGTASGWGPYESAAERRSVAQALGCLHAATDRIPDDLPRREDFAIPSRAELEAALRDLDARWGSGPFAEPTRALLGAHAEKIERLASEYDVTVAEARRSKVPWVITHGEPHRANVVRGPAGEVHLIDWDTTLIAPRERDLRMVVDDAGTGLDEYAAAGADASLDARIVELYGRWWQLADIAGFVDVLRRSHVRTADTAAAWENLAAIVAAA